MGGKIFVDTANNSKPHICYDPEGRFFEVNDLAELIGKYDEVYIDSSIFPNMWPQLKALICNGVRVFYFTRPWTWRRFREEYADELKEEFGRKKTDYGDAYILSRIHGKPGFFEEVTWLDVEFKPLLVVERALADKIQALYQMQSLGIDVEGVAEIFEKELMRVRGEIVRKTTEKIPKFDEIAKELGLDDNNVNALSALAGLLIYLRWPYEVVSMHKAIRYLGLYKPTRENIKKFEERYGESYRMRYNGDARRYLNSLIASILRKEKGVFPPRARDEKELLRKLLNVLRNLKEAATGGGAG